LASILGGLPALGQVGKLDLLRPKGTGGPAETVAVQRQATSTQPGTTDVETATPGSESASKGLKAAPRLLADQTALVPGQTVDLAIAFTLQEGWHIYWQNPGEGGMATVFTWDLPAGFEAGELRYPGPKRHVDALDAATFIMEGDPVLLTTLRVPADAEPGGEVTIAADGRWLACREVCVIEKGRLELKMPIVSDKKDAKPANVDEFKAARSRLPLPAERAEYLSKLSAVADVDRIKPGAKFRIAVLIEVAKGYHLNSAKPLADWTIPTDLFPYAVEGIDFGRPTFPPGVIVASKLGDMSIYSGQTVVVLPAEADAELDGKEVRLRGVVTYQACSDETSQCYPPTGAEWELKLPLAQAGEPVTAANEELFARATGSRAAVPVQSSEEGSWLQRAQASLSNLGLVGWIVMALVGGFILNLTPCVLPVVSIKILSFVQQAGEGRLRVFTLGLAFAAGIEASFLAFGGIIMGLGQHLGVSQQWGGLFQSPQVVIGLAAVVLAFALSLFGVFALNPPRVVNELGEKVQREGHAGAFGMGLLATLLGTACTAPFLSAVVAIAVKQTTATGMLIFAAAGLGMAFPYVLLAAKPAWIKIIPKPGPWMTTFEHLMGFLLLAMAIWLLEALPVQIGAEGLLLALAFLLLIAIAAWVYGRLGFDAPWARKVRSYVIIAVLVVGGWNLCFTGDRSIPKLAETQKELRMGTAGGERSWSDGGIPWAPYTRQRTMEAVEAGKTAFIDYTAEWCKSCQANEKFVLNTSAVREAMQRLGVVPFKADFTSFDPEIQKDLARFGRSGVPMYVVIPAGKPDEPILLDEVITSASVIAALEKAGPSRDTEKSGITTEAQGHAEGGM